MRKITTAAVLLTLALLASPSPGFGQGCLHRGAETAAERQRRTDALIAVRFINSAESAARRTGTYRPLSELSRFLAPHRSDGGRLGEIARQMRFDTDEVLAGWTMQLVAGSDAYMLMMRDDMDPCGYGYASSDDGIVLEGHRVGPPQSLITQ
jgi:hypothetical protein